MRVCEGVREREKGEMVISTIVESETNLSSGGEDSKHTLSLLLIPRNMSDFLTTLNPQALMIPSLMCRSILLVLPCS